MVVDGARVRCRARRSLTHNEVRSLSLAPGAFTCTAPGHAAGPVSQGQPAMPLMAAITRARYAT
jgi:hypothetical protein